MILRKFAAAIVVPVVLCAGLALCAAPSWAAPVAAAADAVGEVSLVIGVARLKHADAQEASVVRGMAVRAGDRIETLDGGHVHLRFSDGGFVSVRPGSRLLIQAYHLDPKQPADNSIRFTLERGVLRSITGKAAEADHDRFRLNTPLAAIGVRGTDFVVQSSDDFVRATVHRGAIVMAPLGEGCSAEALGPCQTAGARTLAADMGQVMLEFRGQQGVTRVVPINGVTAPDRPASPDRAVPPAAEEPRSTAPRRGDALVNAANEVLANKVIVGAPAAQPSPPAPDVTPVQPTPLPPGPITIIDPPVEQPPVTLPTPLPPASTLVWGRWWNAAPLVGDNLSVSYTDASSNGRKISIGDERFGLFRADADSNGSISTNLGRADFNLLQSYAYLQRGSLTEAAKVDGAWLSVDFGSRTFSTGLTASSAATGSVGLNVSGKVTDDALFGGKSADGTVTGAMTLNGKEAAYLFSRPVSIGTISGITVWGR